MRHAMKTMGAALFGAAIFAISALAADKPAAPASGVDPDALAALDRMGTELRSHQNIDVKSDVLTEDVLENGQKLQYAGTVETQARRPNAFRISMVSDLKDRQIYYDGKTVTIFSPRLGYYASFPAPDTIGKTLVLAKDKFAIDVPLADLFAWGTDKELIARVKSGFFVRMSMSAARSAITMRSGTSMSTGRSGSQRMARRFPASWSSPAGTILPCRNTAPCCTGRSRARSPTACSPSRRPQAQRKS